jgi:hypothetical protein
LLVSIYSTEPSINDALSTLRKFWESLTEHTRYSGISRLDTVESVMVSLCARQDNEAEGMHSTRELWTNFSKQRPDSVAFVSMTKSLGSYYADNNQRDEFDTICRVFDDVYREDPQLSREKQLAQDRSKTLEALYDRAGLDSSRLLKLNRALRFIDENLYPIIYYAHHLLRNPGNRDGSTLDRMLKDSLRMLRHCVATDERFLGKLNRQTLENDLLLDAYVKFLDALTLSEQFDKSDALRLDIMVTLALLYLRGEQVDRGMRMLTEVAEVVVLAQGQAAPDLVLVGFNITVCLRSHGNFGPRHPLLVQHIQPIQFGIHKQTAKELVEVLFDYLLLETTTAVDPESRLVWRIRHGYEEYLFEEVCATDRTDRLKSMYESFWAQRLSSWTTDEMSEMGLKLAKGYLKQGRPSDAIIVAEEVVQHESLSPGSPRMFYTASNTLSFIYTSQGDYEKSLKIHSDILYNYGRNRDNHYFTQMNLKGRALERLGRWSEAETLYDKMGYDLQKLWGNNRTLIKRKLGNILEWSEQSKWRKMDLAAPQTKEDLPVLQLEWNLALGIRSDY